MNPTSDHESAKRIKILRTFSPREMLRSANIEAVSHLTWSGILNLVFKVFYTAAMFLTSVILNRIMGPENYGIYSFAYAIVMILVVPSHFGLPILIVREVSRSLETEDWASIRGILQWSAKLSGILSAVIICGFLGYVLLFPTTISQNIRDALLFGILFIPFFSLTINIGGALRGFHKIILGQLPEQILIPFIFLMLVVGNELLNFTSLTPETTMLFHVIAVSLTLIIISIILATVLPKPVKIAKPFVSMQKWLQSMFSLAMITSMRLINKWVSLLILGIFVPPAEVGFFRIAVQMSVLADFGIQIITPVISPKIAGLYARNDIDQIQNIAILTARISFTINMVITTGFLLWGQAFILYFYGAEYQVSYVSLVILLVGQVVNALVGAVANLLNMTGYERNTAFARVITTVLNLGLNFVLCPKFGIIGAAIASSSATILWNILLFDLVHKKLNVTSFAFAKMVKKEDSISS